MEKMKRIKNVNTLRRENEKATKNWIIKLYYYFSFCLFMYLYKKM